MSINRNQPSNRGTRRRQYSRQYHSVTKTKLPGILGIVTNPKIFVGMMVLMGAAMIFSVLPGVSTPAPVSDDGQIRQANELPDVARSTPEPGSTAAPQTSASPVAKRYDTAPAVTVDPARRYIATVKTSKGDFQLELDPRQAPEAVNSFVFLAKEGYYNNTPFMQLNKNQDGSKFVTQAGDPTCRSNAFCPALGTPGYSIRKETTSTAFTRGVVGMGGSSSTSNGGQFFISYGDYPALNGKYTIFGRVIAGMDVVDRLTLLDLTTTDPGQADTILTVDIAES